MKTTHSFGIDFLIRRCKDDKKQALIYARITVDEDRKEISLKERINAIHWDPAKEIVKGKTEQIKSLNKNNRAHHTTLWANPAVAITASYFIYKNQTSTFKYQIDDCTYLHRTPSKHKATAKLLNFNSYSVLVYLYQIRNKLIFQ